MILMEHREMQNFPCFILRRNLIKGDLQRRNTNNMNKDKRRGRLSLWQAVFCLLLMFTKFDGSLA